MALLLSFAGCAPAPSEAHGVVAQVDPSCDGGICMRARERKPRDTYCFRLAETCIWPEKPPADPICDEFCVRGQYKPKAPKK